MSLPPRTRRRFLAAVGTGGVLALSGCSGNDAATYPGTDDEGESTASPAASTTSTTDASPEATDSIAAEPTETPTETATETPTETATSILPADGLAIVGRTDTVRDADGYTSLTALVEVNNTGPHTYRVVELRVDVVYTDPVTAESTRVASGYAERRFEDGFTDGTVRLETEIRFLRDGRADRSLAEADFSLAFELRHLETM